MGLFQVLPRSLRRLLEIACVSSDHNLMELSFVNSEISISGDCDLTKLYFLQLSPVQEVSVSIFTFLTIRLNESPSIKVKAENSILRGPIISREYRSNE